MSNCGPLHRNLTVAATQPHRAPLASLREIKPLTRSIVVGAFS